MANRLHVGQFITQYPYEGQFAEPKDYFCSGAERVAKRLSEELSKKECDVTICTSSATREYLVEQQEDVTVERSPSMTRVNTTQIAPTQIFDPLSKGLEFDIVHAHNSTPPGVLAGWLYAKRKDVPFVITHHGGEQYEPHGSLFRRASLFAYTNFLIDPLFRSADVAVSPTEGYIRESSGLSAAKNVAVIPNGIDVEEYDIGLSNDDAKRQLGIDPESFFVLYMGSLHPRKGVDVLLEGFLQFHEEASDARLVIGGDGALRDELQKRADEYHDDIVSVPGFIPESEKATYMNAADVFVLPSVTAGAEVYPLVLLEAAASETPILASRFDTIESVIGSNEMGAFLQPGSAESVASELKQLYDESDTREQMSANALQMARDRQWPSIAEEYQQLYRSLLE